MDELVEIEASGLAPEDAGRQALFSFLARVLANPISLEERAFIASFANGDAPINRAFADLLRSLEGLDEGALERHYHDLFIGVGRGELLPYGSYYLTGFLNEKPLAELRADLERLGFARAEGVSEPEDHMAAICDVMSHLIGGSGDGEFDVYAQDRFFAAHLRPWAQKFFADLEAAKTAGPYRHVGTIGNIFMEIEEEGFTMVVRA
ncbi:MAG: molecular chaperone TorD family protein [Kiloniellales bacterium]|nr:molecular chaperone TorD family protein [Kiloniellales bacterium]